jgi:nucleotide-binding universal stress UspA family protein
MTVAEVKGTQVRTGAVFSNILVATDFSEPSRRALYDALALARHEKAHLCVVHAIVPVIQYMSLESPPELDRERLETERRMRNFIGDLDGEHKIDSIVLTRGPVAGVVAALIRERGIDLLVIGTRGRGGISKLALGSVAEELLRVAPCPVLTIGPSAEMSPMKDPAQLHTILFATDFGKACAQALPLAQALAREHQAKLILFHAMPPMPTTAGNLGAFLPPAAAADELMAWQVVMRKAALEKLKECLPAETGLEHEPEYVVGAESLPDEILMTAAEHKVDLIVMGANQVLSPRAMAHIPWMVVHEVVKNALCPVLTVAG